ncbi:unnamed protein product [Oppiella nova]|uniref:Uncharacterized protein n=1 Tax=Oppiella nova TaxID=334625 RepID=A0A7R9QJB6_9ACAR|nr:unnamed protein product [Oppiella nova]CAG2166492.1 unnamed protein product [Oppiella nova]
MFIKLAGVPQPLPPLPGRGAVKCLNTVLPELWECRNDSVKNWNVSDYSTLGDVCCAQWDNLECDLDVAANSNCEAEELADVNNYFSQLIDFYNRKTCKDFPRGGTHCILPTLLTLDEQRLQLEKELDSKNAVNEIKIPPQPLPDPLALDCLGTLNPIVRVGCRQVAFIKWNITHHKRPPVRNICCATWDDIDCLDDIAKLKCPQQERVSIESYFSQLESWLAGIGCGQASYHSSNCSTPSDPTRPPVPANEQSVNVQINDQDNIDVIFPARHQRLGVNDEGTSAEDNQLNSDYKYFILNYMMAVFPHLLNLMALLAVILVTVICVQCFIIARQVKHERYFRDINGQGYQKVNI